MAATLLMAGSQRFFYKKFRSQTTSQVSSNRFVTRAQDDFRGRPNRTAVGVLRGAIDRRRRRKGILGAPGRCLRGLVGGPRQSEAGADGGGRSSGGGHAARGPGTSSRRGGRSLSHSELCVLQPRLYPRIHHRPLCVSAPAPEAPQPAALSSLIGSAEGLIDWLPSHSA
ncbi:hypothetical protein MC885_001765 [Smutsia gigantea]|nr:hypothetical protein MC885_001765 [Smutsia gigantea]